MPHLVDVRPAGRFVMSDIDRVGGVPVVMKELLEPVMLHGDCMTVTGKTLAENLAAMDVAAPDGGVVHPPSIRSIRGAGSRSCAATSRPTAP